MGSTLSCDVQNQERRRGPYSMVEIVFQRLPYYATILNNRKEMGGVKNESLRAQLSGCTNETCRVRSRSWNLLKTGNG